VGLNFDDIKAAIAQAVLSASALPVGKVIWSRQDGPSPAVPYITLEMGTVRRVGGTDEADHTFNGSAPAGQEIVERVGGPRVLGVSMEAFTLKVAGTNAGVPLLEKVRTRLQLPSIRDTLRSSAAALTLEDSDEEVLDLSQVRHVGFEGRASVGLYFSTTEIEEDTPVGYIATVQLVDLTGDGVIAPDGFNEGGG